MIFRPHFLIRRTSAGALGLALVSSGVLTGCAQGPRELFTNVFRPGSAEEQLAASDEESPIEPAKKSYFAKLDKGKEGDDAARVTANRLAEDGPESRRRSAGRGTREGKESEPSGTLLAGFMKRSDVNGDREVTDPFRDDVEHADYNENDSVQKPQTSRIEQVSRNEDPLFDRNARRTPQPEDFKRLPRMGTDASAPSRTASNPFAEGFETELDRLRAEVSQDAARDQQGATDSNAAKHPFADRAADRADARESEREHLLRARESELRRREIELEARERELKELAAQEQQASMEAAGEAAAFGGQRPSQLTAEPARSLRELREREDSFATLESNLQPLPPSANLKEVPADYNERQHSLRQHPVEPASRASRFESAADEQTARTALGELPRTDAPEASSSANSFAAERSGVKQASASVNPAKPSDQAALRFGRAETSMIVDASSIPPRLSSEPFTLTPSRVGNDASGGADGNLSVAPEPEAPPEPATKPRTAANHATDVWESAALPSEAPAAPAPPVTSTLAPAKSHRDLLAPPPKPETAAAPAPPAVEPVEAAHPAQATRALGELQWNEEPQAAASRRVRDYWGMLALLAGSAAAAVVGYCLRHKLPLIRRRHV